MSEHKVKPDGTHRVRHGDVSRDLAEGIASGRYPVGSLLPPELELCDLYEASRHTMRVAIGELVQLGLVSRRKRAGTRVEARTPPDVYRQSLASLEELTQFGEAHLRVVQEVGEVVAGVVLAKALGCPAGSRWLRMSSLRLDAQGSALPVGWTDVYVAPDCADILAQARETPAILVGTLIERRRGRPIVEVAQDVCAVPLPERLARPLQAEAGSPALGIVRRYADVGGEVLEYSDTIHPAGRFTLSSRLERGPGG